jgi:hypothetical protein
MEKLIAIKIKKVQRNLLGVFILALIGRRTPQAEIPADYIRRKVSAIVFVAILEMRRSSQFRV